MGAALAICTPLKEEEENSLTVKPLDTEWDDRSNDIKKLKLRWNVSKYNNISPITLSKDVLDNCPLITKDAGGNDWSTHLLNNIIDNQTCNKFEWEYTIMKWYKNQYFQMGFIESPLNEHMKQKWKESLGASYYWGKCKKYAIEIGNYAADDYNYPGGYIKIYGKNKICNDDKLHSYHKIEAKDLKFEVGDRFRISIDFKQEKVTFFYNNRCIGDCWTNFKHKKITPALSLMDPGGKTIEIKISKWKIYA